MERRSFGTVSCAGEGAAPLMNSGFEAPDLREAILLAWRTNNRATVFLIERLPAQLWQAAVPGTPRKSIRMIAGHIHNARCTWIKKIGKEHGIPVPAAVDRRKVTRRDLVSALKQSSAGIEGLLQLACASGGRIPIPSTYVWRNLPLDVAHVLTYFAAHEGHHRGQIVLAARQSGHRLPLDVTGGIWQWTKFAREVRG